MDERKRLLIFFVMSMVIFYGWFAVGPVIFPQWFPQAPKKVAGDAEPGKEGDDKKDGDRKPSEVANAGGADNPNKPEEPQEPKEEDANALKLPSHPSKSITLGSLDPKTGYSQQVTITSTGAAVLNNQLNDSRYKDSISPPDADGNRHPVRIVGNHLEGLEKVAPLLSDSPPLTFQSWIETVDEEFAAIDEDAGLRTLSWELVKTIPDPDDDKINAGVVFQIKTPDGQLQFEKQYFLNKFTGSADEIADKIDVASDAYLLDVNLSFRNLGDELRSFEYMVQGPTGLPLENKKNTRKYRDFKIGFWQPGSSVRGEVYTVVDIVGDTDDDELEIFEPGKDRRLQYVGIDVQYFAALILPQDKAEELKEGFIDVARPQVTDRFREKYESDISLALRSTPVVLDGGGKVTHEYKMFLGPKRDDVLSSIDASSAMDFSTWFGIGYVSRGMMAILRSLHDIHIPWGISIIMLTMMVRGCMFPISRKQAAGAKKMKELQPRIAELKKKYANDKEKLGRAQMELFAEANYNPLAGCLPMFLQLPIFIGLYQALNNAVDLRMTGFLWIENLAAPDALFRFPWLGPEDTFFFLGQTFNILPIITVILFVAQQKMFMPPPTDEQSAMQYKMMNYMMIFMGFLFYKMPAGLCVYFIASSLWGMGERKLLDIYGKKPEDTPATTKGGDSGVSSKKGSSQPDAKAPQKNGFWAKLSARLEEAAEMQQQAQRDAARSKKSKSKR